MADFSDPFSRHPRPSWRARSQSTPLQTRHRSNSKGIVGPGRVLSKEEREQRKSVARADSTISALDGQTVAERTAEEEKYEYSFDALLDKVMAMPGSWPWLVDLGLTIDEHFAPGSCVAALQLLRDDNRPHSARAFLVSLLLLLTVFGSLYTILEYLLLATRVSAACSVSTVFVPVTYTVTEAAIVPSSSSSSNNDTGNASAEAPAVTSTSTRVLTSYVTVGPSTTSGSTLPYIYSVNSAGSTEWVDGRSPSSGVSLVYATTSVTVAPIQSAQTTIYSTSTDFSYLTVPQYTSTVYSYVAADPSTLTSTSTSTHWVTYTLDHVAPTSSSRASFSGMAHGGWNSTTSATATVQPAAQPSTEPDAITYTSVYALASGDPTTSTSTTYLTTTVELIYTTTIPPSYALMDPGSFITTITALPVTITDGMGAGYTLSSTADAISVSMSSLSSSNDYSITRTISAVATPTSSTPGKISTTLSATGVSVAADQSSGSYNMASVFSITATLPSYGASSASSTASTSQSLNSSSQAVSTGQTSSTMFGTGMPRISRTISAAGSWNSTMSSAQSGLMSSGIPHLSSANSGAQSTTGSISVAALSTGSPSTMSGIAATGGTSGSRLLSYGPVIASTASIGAASQSPASSSPSSPGGTRSVPSTAGATSPGSTTGVLTTSSLSTSLNSSPSTTMQRSSIQSTSSNATTSSRSASAWKASASSAAVATLSTRSGHQHTSQTSASSIASAASLTSLSMTNLTPYATLHTTGSSSFSTGASSHSHNSSMPSSAAASPSASCGERGPFTITFDDLPNFMPTENDTTITQAPAIFSPYHHLTFSDGYVYAPAPSEPYRPVSTPHLAVFLSNSSGVSARQPSKDFSKPGEIGDGPRESMSAFWFDAHSAWFGCDDAGPKACTLVFTAYSWSAATQDEVPTFSHNATIPPCAHFEDCRLQKTEFPTSFRGLTGLQILAYVDNQPKMFFMDNLAMAWSNNTCAAGLQRQSSP